MKLGSFGDLVFEVGADRILSFPTLARSGSARIEKHEIAGSRPIAEFVGPGDENISFELYLARHLGVEPEVELKKLRTARDTGMRYPLIIGGEVKGGAGALWMVAELSEDSTTDQRGQTISSQVSVSLTLAPDPPNVVATTGKVAKNNVTRKKVGTW